MPSEIAVPFRLDGNGRVVTVTDPDAQVRLHVVALINTLPPERAMVPGYGVDTSGLVFMDDPEEVGVQVALRVREGMRKHEPGVDLVSSNPEVFSDDGGLTSVAVEYRRLDAPDSASVANANRALIGANGVVREIVRG